MSKYLAIYIGSLSGHQKNERGEVDNDETRNRRGMEAWGAWVVEHASAIVDHGSPVGRTICASVGGISNTENRITAYTIVEAESHEAAAKMFENHPHFSIFSGNSVEIMECLPMPKGP
ncbi:hypothetical protein [Pseudoxanthomonas mexicana]|uniref:hypothetical protein n=1 Tax=Pseudoxanthomonas mexicana TaxID=128785 RepID=UPI0007836A5B|nr:hypothetical protein [Pseudoxanthomonas mexicana]